MTVRLTSAQAEQRIKRVRAARGVDRSNFCAVVERAGLDPGKDLRFGNFSGADFAGCNLKGYDFTGAALVGCNFKGARIVGAKFAQCEYAVSRSADRTLDDPACADDSHEAYRLADKVDFKVPDNFDNHIEVGTYFRDFEFAPLMRCVILKQPNGIVAKMAVAASESDTSRCRLRWENFSPDRPNRFRDYIDSLNRDLGFGHYFQYKIVHPRRALFELQDPETKPQRFDVKAVTDEGLTFLTLNLESPPSTVRGEEFLAFIDRSSREADSVSVYTGKIARRMRVAECELPRDFDDRSQTFDRPH